MDGWGFVRCLTSILFAKISIDQIKSAAAVSCSPRAEEMLDRVPEGGTFKQLGIASASGFLRSRVKGDEGSHPRFPVSLLETLLLVDLFGLNAII